MLAQAVKYADESTGRILMVTSWNEWHEDTQIEPVEKGGVTWLDGSETGEAFSEGLDYEGYGERYLEILLRFTKYRMRNLRKG